MSVTGSSQGIQYSVPYSVIARSAATKQSTLTCFAALDCFASLAMTKVAICYRRSLVEEIQRQAGPGPVHRDEFALAGQRDVGGLQVGAAEGDIGGDAIAGRHLLDDGAVRRDHRNAARDERRHADIAASFHRERVEHLVAAEPRDRLAALAAIDHVARLDLAGRGEIERPQARRRGLRGAGRA